MEVMISICMTKNFGFLEIVVSPQYKFVDNNQYHEQTYNSEDS